MSRLRVSRPSDRGSKHSLASLKRSGKSGARFTAHLLTSAILVGFAVAILAGASIALWSKWGSSDPEADLTVAFFEGSETFFASSDPMTLPGLLTGTEESLSSVAALTVVIERLSPSEGRLGGFVSLEVPCDSLAQLRDNQTGQSLLVLDEATGTPIREEGQPLRAQIKPEYQDVSLTLHISDWSGDSFTELPVPLSDLAECGSYAHWYGAGGAWSTPLELSLVGQTSSYPDDWYLAHVSYRVTLPSGLSYGIPPAEATPAPTGRPNDNTFLPLLAYFVLGAGMVGEEAQVSREGSLDQFPANRELYILIQRDWPTKAFAYAMALVPIAVGVLLLHLLFLTGISRREPMHHLLLNVAAAMLAVLPLRQVLVPADINEVTRVDLLLGLGLAAIVCMALVRYVTLIWIQYVRDPAPGE